MKCLTCGFEPFKYWVYDYYINLCKCNMMKLQDFINIVDITKQDGDIFGHYPMTMLCETLNNEINFFALAVDGVEEIYKLIKLRRPDCKSLFLAVDFPAISDLDNDFVFIMHDKILENEFGFCALPYCRDTGRRFPVVYDAKALKHISINYQQCVL